MRYFDIHVFLGSQDGFSAFVEIPESIIGKGIYDESLVVKYAIDNNYLYDEDVEMISNITEISGEEFSDVVMI